jgi:hypothetical protein
MPKRLFDRLALFLRARLDVTTATGPVCPTQRRYAMNFLDMSDPPRFRDEAVVTLHEFPNLGVRGHFMPFLIVRPRCDLFGGATTTEYLWAGGKSGLELGQHRRLRSRNLRTNAEQTAGCGGHRARSIQQPHLETSGLVWAELLGHGLDQVRPRDEKFGVGAAIEPSLEQSSCR